MFLIYFLKSYFNQKIIKYCLINIDLSYVGESMDNRKLIIILLIIIIILLVSILTLITNPFKAESVLNITSNDELHDGDSLTIVLTDKNSNPLANQTVTVIITDASGKQDNRTIETDSMGNGFIQLKGFTQGSYTVEVSYDGNNDYSASSASQNLTITEDTVQDGSSGQHKVVLELSNFDEYVKKDVGEYTVEAYKWTGPSLGGLGVWVYKNGKLIDRYSYSSRAYFWKDGEWKWSEWDSGDVDSVYHKYHVSPNVKIQKVEVMF